MCCGAVGVADSCDAHLSQALCMLCMSTACQRPELVYGLMLLRGADAEKLPEAEPLMQEDPARGRRHTEPTIPPAADLYLHDHAHNVSSTLSVLWASWSWGWGFISGNSTG